MSDFFGGVLDPIRDIGDDVSQFLGVSSSQLGTSVAKGVGAAYPQNSASKLIEANRVAQLDNVPEGKFYQNYKGAQGDDNKFKEAKPESFESVEGSWLQRLRKFSQIDNELEAGKVNEGKDQ